MTAFSALDHQHMTRALRLAELGLTTTDPNPRVGCVIARDAIILGEGSHERAGEPHAEVLALRAAGTASRGATAYVTLEPCNHHGRTPPCADALIAAGIARVVCAMDDPNPLVHGAGIARLRAAGIRVDSGLLSDAAHDLNCGFVQRMKRGLPWVRVKLGVSLDGRTALANDASRWITGEPARADVQRWRARSSAILTGSGTVLKDDPRLEVRSEVAGASSRQPLRVVADSELRTPASARLLDLPGAVLIFTAATAAPRRAELEARGARVEAMGRAAHGLDLRQLLQRLAQLAANEVWVESGSRLAGALLEERLVNELVIYIAPMVLGTAAHGMFQLPAITSLEQRWALQFTDVRMVGGDLRIIARPAG